MTWSEMGKQTAQAKEVCEFVFVVPKTSLPVFVPAGTEYYVRGFDSSTTS